MGYLEETREVRYVMSTLDNDFCYIYEWSAYFSWCSEKGPLLSQNFEIPLAYIELVLASSSSLDE